MPVVEYLLSLEYEENQLRPMIREGFLSACKAGTLKTVQVLQQKGHLNFLHPSDWVEGLRHSCQKEHFSVQSFLVVDCHLEETPAIKKLLLNYPLVQSLFDSRHLQQRLSTDLPAKKEMAPRRKL